MLKFRYSCHSSMLTLVLGVLFVGQVFALDLSDHALAKISPRVLDEFAAHGDGELIVLLDDLDIAHQARLTSVKQGMEVENQAILRSKGRAYADLKHAVFRRFDRNEITFLKSYKSLPMVFVKVANLKALYKLLENDRVTRVFENAVHSLSLTESLPLIGQVESLAGGHTGQGTTIAILDTGVDYKRTAFGSCVSPGMPGDCKVVFADDFAVDDGELDMNGHGTNVAGIVLGVAPETKLVSLDVFTGIGIHAADAIAAIDWVIANQAVYNIVAMNMSFGTDFFEEICESSWATTPFANARAVGVAPIVASGNDGEIDGVKNPACAPGAIRVGAVHDIRPDSSRFRFCGSELKDVDIVACFSNSASYLDLLAPGVDVTAAELTKSGTSMATPHVAGAYAVLKGASAYPEDGIDATVDRLKDTGKLVLDDRNGLMFPRIDLEAALFELLPDQVPEIESFHPDTAAEGEVIQVLGSGFRGVSEVLIGNTPAYDFTVKSSHLIVVNVGSGASGEVRVATSLGSNAMGGFVFIDSVRETEPNNDPGGSNPIMITDKRLVGELSDQDDVDVYRFGLDQGQVSIGIRPVRSLCCSRYIQLTLQDSQGTVLASRRVGEETNTAVLMDVVIEQRGAYYLLVSATPEEEPVFEGDYQITVPDNTYTNTAPVISSAPQDVVFAGQHYAYAIEADDADGDTIYYEFLSGPAGMTIDKVTGGVNWQPGPHQAGSNEVELRVYDDFGGYDVQSFNIIVIDSASVKVSATDGTFKNHVRVTFNLVNGATVYRVFRCQGDSGECGAPVGFVKNGSFNDRKVIPGIAYHYRVRVCTPFKCSGLSAADAGFAGIAPVQPTGIRATDGSFSDLVRVTFNPVDGAVVYRVFRCLDRGQTCGLPVGFPRETVFDDKRGDPGTVYFYRVKACNSQHCGKFSVANSGYSSPAQSAVQSTTIRQVAQPIPVLGNQGRWLLILVLLVCGCFSGCRAYQAGKLD